MSSVYYSLQTISKVRKTVCFLKNNAT
uniref:Uncharacterized protein n=1 Tax=Arundo donax TaxID=35708 RepID=A0A0A9BJN3_ARUDO